MRCTKIFLLLCVLAGFGSVKAVEYDLGDLERMALAANRAAKAADARVEAARSAVDTASAWPNPELEYLSGTQRARAPGGTPGDARSLSLTQPLDLPWMRSPRIAVAVAALQGSEAENQLFRTELLSRLRLRYFELLRREAELRNARDDAFLMEKVRSGIAQRVEQGEAPRYELIKADAEMLNAQKVAQAAGFRVEQARSLLRQSLGVSLPAEFTLRGALRNVPELPPREQLQAEVVRNNPELQMGRTDVVRAERQLELERSLRLPRLAVKAGVDEDPDVRTSRVGLVLTVPLWDRRSGPLGEAAAQLTRARHHAEAQSFSIAEQLEVAYQQYEIALAQVTALESGILKQAENALRVAEAAYRFGERGYIEVLDAQRVRRAARSELIAARFELAAAWVEIERLRALPSGRTE